LDRVRHDNASAAVAPIAPVYLVIPYSLVVPAAAYLNYFDDYVHPQMEGWIREGVLTHYDLLLQRYTAARPWDSLLILHYRDDTALGRRENIMAKVRQQLQTQPKWKALSESKQTIRTEKEAIIADELRPAIR
jgi:CO dehydrogenase/acetyl-CoA synthase alpha subunit